MYMAVSDISYIAESVVLGVGKWLSGEVVGLQYSVWLLCNINVKLFQLFHGN